jgi:hypothetical protein
MLGYNPATLGARVRELTVVLNWTDELRRRMSAK